MKAPGPDGILNLVLKKNINVITPSFLKIINACLNLCYFPKEWKKANVIIILKKGKKNDGSPRSYRPISLLSNLGKVFEKVIMHKLYNLSSEKNWISTLQFGFSKGKSTVDAVDNVVTVVENNNLKKKFTLCIFFDIKGAFDNAWHPGIIKKLIEKECPGSLIKLVHSYFNDRVVTYQNEVSRALEKSCPQGGILSPFLWLININDLLNEKIDKNCIIQAYADDICMIISSESIGQLEEIAQKVFTKFEEWSAKNKLEFDKNKTEAVLFTNKHKVPKITLKFGGDIIEVKEKVKYLGVILDRKLLWTDHVVSRINSAKQYSTRLLCAAKTTWGLKPFALRKLYKSVVESTILYAVPVWIAALKKKHILRKIKSAQRISMLTISKSFRSAQSEVITAISGVLPIHIRAYELTALRYALQRPPSKLANVYSTFFPFSSKIISS